MFSSILIFIIGAIFGIVAYSKACNAWMKAKIKNDKLALVRYSEHSKEWVVHGRLAGLAQKVADIRNGRQPGAIKYVD
ncbi:MULTISPECIES: DUF7299 family protein [Gammaproteobacteria]|uniref:DUF7299 family protein n=1 Tax=Gammaproteobacteria TaxID=1236 RepID=UPI002FC80B6B